jgi:hypothetical protein
MMTMNASTITHTTATAVNPKFEHVYQVFTSRNWIVKENTKNSISFYLKELFPYDDFSLNVEPDGKIDAVVPMWDSYRCISKLFDDYESANKYLCDKLDYYESTKDGLSN